MQDRFKFRTYIPDLKFFKYWGWIEDNHYVGLCACGDYQMPELLEKYTHQCTGLKDKNGTLIYEGDILKEIFETDGEILTDITTVEYLEGSFILRSQECPNDFAYFPDVDSKDYEVIGNIYENKELLQ